ncbi:M1 family metallopeptidase, partial [candidate division KSB1 bacterium]|nr:M1 family metallopeptidase [candidate division KSB1 bacterium]
MKTQTIWFLLFGLALGSSAQDPPQMSEQKSNLQDKGIRSVPVLFSGQDESAIDVLHYTLEFNFPYVSSSYTGRSEMRVRVLQSNLEAIDLHMEGLISGQVTVNDQAVETTLAGDQIQIDLPITPEINDTLDVSITFGGAPDEHGFYFYDRCAYTMSEPEDARAWFPCHDVPWDKATAELTITVPQGVEVASIGLLQSQTIDPIKQTETFIWKTDLQVATYLFCITMSDEYAIWSDWFVTDVGDSIEMPYYILREDSAMAVIDVTAMPDAMTIYSNLFGAYPFEKYGTAEVTPFRSGGMEHQTMTTVNRSWIQGNRAVENGFVHELAHMWWGDAVTLEDWPDIWLNEGFATYSEALFFEQYYGRERFQEKVRYMRNQYLNRSKARDFPIYDPPSGELFNWGISYNKAGFVLHMLRALIGDAVFFDILQTYFETYLYQNASTAQFQAVCELVSGKDLNAFFEQWVYQSGYPQLEYAWYSESAGSEGVDTFIRIEQVQNSKTIPIPIFSFPLDLRIHSSSTVQDTTIWINDAMENFVFRLSARPDSIELDPEIRLIHTAAFSETGALRSSEIPSTFDLLPNFPNHFNPSTAIYYNVPKFADGLSVGLEL